MIACTYLILLSVFLKLIYKNWVNPAVLMTIIWAFVVFIFKLNLISLNSVDERTLFVISFGVSMFDIGVIIAKRISINIIKNDIKQKETEYFINYTFIILLGIISILLLMPDTINCLKYLINGKTFSYIRITNNETVLDNIVLRLIKNYIAEPFIIFFFPFTAWCVLSPNSNKKFKKIIVLIALVLAIMQMISGGGRASIVYLVIHFLVMYSLLGNRFIISKKIKYLIISLTIIVVIIVYYVSLSRGISNVGQSMIMYICGSVPMLDVKISEIISGNTYTYGGAFLFGFIDFISNFFDNLGFAIPEFVNEISRLLYAEQNIQVGTNINMNAFVSWFHALFLDGGLIALAIESFIYGSISEGFYKRALYNNTNIKRLIGYSIIAQTIVFSMVRFQFIKYHYILAFFFIPLLIKDKTSLLSDEKL